MPNVNIVTTITRKGKAKSKNWKNSALLNVLNSALAALDVDLANTALQVQAGILPAQTGPFDQKLVLSIVVTHTDGSAFYSDVQTYENFSQAGVDSVMAKVKHHMDPLNAKAT